MQERAAVFVLGRGIHDDQRPVARVQPEITAEAGIGGSRAQGVHGQVQGDGQAGQPVADLRQAGVWRVFKKDPCGKDDIAEF